jgi:cytochrome P450
LQVPKIDIITRFLRLAEDESNGVDAKLIRDIVLNFVIAGRDSTAVTLSWFMYSIIKKKQDAKRIFEELQDFESKFSGASENVQDVPPTHADKRIQEFAKLLSYTNLKTELPFLQAALSETLRLFPAVPLVGSQLDY